MKLERRRQGDWSNAANEHYSREPYRGIPPLWLSRSDPELCLLRSSIWTPGMLQVRGYGLPRLHDIAGPQGLGRLDTTAAAVLFLVERSINYARALPYP